MWMSMHGAGGCAERCMPILPSQQQGAHIGGAVLNAVLDRGWHLRIHKHVYAPHLRWCDDQQELYIQACVKHYI